MPWFEKKKDDSFGGVGPEPAPVTGRSGRERDRRSSMVEEGWMGQLR